LDVPVALTEGVKSKLVCDFCCIHSVREILLVGKDKEDSIAELVFVEHAVQFVAGFTDTIAIIAIHDENQALSILEVMSPKRADLWEVNDRKEVGNSSEKVA
jgi:hypothetical protein